ncbi:MAG: GNAT family N-acetyltransferase, partial [Anaerolineae bacterium]|nr:GNAT family N-acetyltransferase [Anaerolineae bacterium]
MSEAFVIREIKDIKQDAEKLVAMWQASDDQWPGTWSGGAELTTHMVTDIFERDKNLFVYVVEAGDKIVGYCSFNECEDDKGVGYVGLLNVQPDYQKKSLARKMLCQCVDRCVELGFKQLTLHTWPGNLKSVPLYKKTGLYWVPDSSVHMRNFIPGILALPCAKPYFAQHDWYKSLQRELDQKEDDERWEGMKVFTYRWQAGDDRLTVWVDRESRTVTAVETNELMVGAIAETIEPARGLSTQMRWKLVNKKAKPMLVSLIANGSDQLQIEHREAVTLKPGQSVEITARVTVAADTPEVRRGKAVPTVKTLCIIDGQVIELATGLRPQPAVSVELSPRYVTLFPGVSKHVYLQLRSYLDREIEATVSLSPMPGLEIDWTEKRIALPKKSFAGAPITLSAADGGVYEIQATVYFDDSGAQCKTLPQQLAVLSLPAGGVLAQRSEAKQVSPAVRIENEWTRLVIESNGWMQIRETKSNADLGGMREFVGPPFWPSELEDKEFDLDLKSENGRVIATLSAALNDHPGLTLRREVTMGAGPLIEIAHTLVNQGTVVHTLQMLTFIHIGQRDGATVVFPLKNGFVQSRLSEFPAAEEDVSRKPETFAERWAAVTSRYGTFGPMWPETIVENQFGGWGAELMEAQVTCDPQQWTQTGRFYLYAGPGDWKTVREHARRLVGTDAIEEPIPVEPHPVYGVRLEPSPLIALDDQVDATLVINNLRARPLDGQAQIALPEDMICDQTVFEIQGVTIKESFKHDLHLTVPSQATACEGKVSLQTRLFDAQISVPIIRLGSRSDVDVSQDGTIWHIDNGCTRFDLAPDFCGSVVAWVENGVNHLLSPYPKPATFSWMNNWYGGIMPLAMLEHEMPGKLWQETFTAQAVKQRDGRGFDWQGVRLSCEFERDKLVGLAIDLDYLTVGNSNVLKVVYRLRNLTTAKRSLGFGWHAYWQPDGEREHNVVRSAFVERKPTPWESWSEAGKWGMVTNSKTGRT